MKRAYNFNAGPGALPLSVLETVQKEMIDYKGSGMSVTEISHRTPLYDDINTGAMNLARELMGVGEDYKILFVGGGASTQFAMVAANFLPADKVGAYVDTGTWASKAIKEAQKVGKVHIAGSSKDAKYTFIPKMSDIKFPKDAAYLHITGNNTIEGTEYTEFPETGNVPLIADMSSDMFSRPQPFKKFSLIYAGAQKNLAPAGVTMVAVRDEMLAKCKDGNFTMLDYRTHAKANSLYNTPPVFCIYVLRLTLQWIKDNGGLEGVAKINAKKKDIVYNMIDKYPDYFRCPVEKASRSWMNLVFRLPTEELEKKFIAEGKALNMIGIKGHRDVGGIRVSLYNAVPMEAAQAVADLMEKFRKNN